MRSSSFLVALVLLGSLAACSSKDVARAGGQGPDTTSGGGGGGSGQGAGGRASNPNEVFIPECDPNDPTSDCAETVGVCGDGILTDDEACDDGNVADGDGCAGNCLKLEVGYSCAKPGEACRQIARCGDGLQTFPELCDDGNKEAGDGCSATCKVEIGFKCDGGKCVPTVCGDGIVEGAESCDDGNTQPFDGCSVNCQAEPDCSAGACTSECGDGLVLGEECDDGNLIDGDGCSASCTIEGGFECGQDDNCEMINDECVLRVSSIFRDFTDEHPDFQPNCSALVLDVVEPALVDGRPKLNTPPKACITSADSFDQWYTDGPGRTTVVGSIVLFSNGKGGFVNRYGEMGEKWVSYTNQDYNCAADCVPCSTNPTQMCTAGTVVEWDGDPLFFPLDGETTTEEKYRAKVPEQYGWNGWPWEDQVFTAPPNHNFYFTTEVKYWFSYDENTDATLIFTGDDDVWVFVNGVLAADLGGVHVPQTATVTINATTAATYNLTLGNAYQVSVFHAERKQEGSSFQLTLDGFNTARSECRPVCGDGLVGLGEECDDGVNDGGYGECAAECVLGPHCGDGIVQAEHGEDCDDGNNVDDETCPSACRKLKVRNN